MHVTWEKSSPYDCTLPPAHGHPLLAQPAPRRLALALQNDRVGLQTRRHVIPRRGDEAVFATKRFEFLLEFRLRCVSLFAWKKRDALKETEKAKKITGLTDPCSALSCFAFSSSSRKDCVIASWSCKSYVCVSLSSLTLFLNRVEKRRGNGRDPFVQPSILFNHTPHRTDLPCSPGT